MPIDAQDVAVLKEFVRNGGRLVEIDADFGGNDDVAPRVGISRPAPSGTHGAIAIADNRYTRGVERVRGPIDALFTFGSSVGTPLLANARGVVATRSAYGKGEVVAVTAPSLFANAHVGERDNATFAYDAIAGHGPIAFDEYVHGYDDDMTFWQALPVPVRGALVLVAAVVVLALAGANLPFAPPVPLEPPDERDTSAYLRSMAALMRRARAASAAIAAVCADARRRARGKGDRDAAISLAELDRLAAVAPSLRGGGTARRRSRLPTTKGPPMSASVNELAGRIAAGMERAVVDAQRTAFGLTVALLARGHVLIEGVPGTGKTLAVRVLATLLGVPFRRIQFTPDMMPADVVGTTVFNPATAQFSIRTGPIVASVVLADEINRTPPKTQAALLEAMEEGRVTIDGTPFALPAPFLLCATQNPIEYEGTYPLPEAQLDRFMVKIESSYPPEARELELLERVAAGFDSRELEASGIVAVTQAGEILDAQRAIRKVHLSAGVREYAYRIVAATRAQPRLTLGASPRAGIAVLVASQAAAAIDGREFATPDDVKDVAPMVLPHRLIVAPDAEIEGVTAADLLREILAGVAVPRE